MKISYNEGLEIIKIWSSRSQNLRNYLDNPKSKNKHKAVKLLAQMSDRVVKMYQLSFVAYHKRIHGNEKERSEMQKLFEDYLINQKLI